MQRQDDGHVQKGGGVMGTTFWKMGMFGCTSAPVSITSESPSSIMACCASASVGRPVGRTLFCLLILPFLSFGILFYSPCDSEAVDLKRWRFFRELKK